MDGREGVMIRRITKTLYPLFTRNQSHSFVYHLINKKSPIIFPRFLNPSFLTIFVLFLFIFHTPPIHAKQLSPNCQMYDAYHRSLQANACIDHKKIYYLYRNGYWYRFFSSSFESIRIAPQPLLTPPSVSLSSGSLFQPYQAIPTGSFPEAVAIGDVNGDGRNDVVLTTSDYFDPANDHKIHIFLQNASGTLDPPIKMDAGYRPSSIDIADVNHDGRLDVVVGNENRDTFGIFYQNPSGSLNPITFYSSPFNNARYVKCGDLNHDFRVDVAAMGWGTNEANVLLQNNSGALDPPVTYSVQHGGYDEIDTGDVTGDGKTDLIVMSGQLYAVQNFAVLKQLPNGNLDGPVYYDLSGNILTNGIANGDVNGDGLRDVVVTYGGNRPDSHIAVFLQNATGTLDPPVSYPSYDIPEPIEIGDINFDGRYDVVVLHGGWLRAGVYLQQSNGTLAPEDLYPIPYATHYNPQGLAIGDINSDGAPDLAIADYNQGLVLLYHTPPCDGISLGPDTLPVGMVGTPYNQVISAQGGTAPYIYEHTSGLLPVNLTFTSTGVLSGVPKVPGTYHFALTAGDTNGCLGTKMYDLTVLGKAGEASGPGSPMTVTKGTGTVVNISYTPAPCATDHVLYWGTTTGRITSLNWTNSRCGLGTSGSTSFDPGPQPSGTLVYFVIVGNNGIVEGSYGRNSQGIERPEASGLGSCDYPQDMAEACSP